MGEPVEGRKAIAVALGGKVSAPKVRAKVAGIPTGAPVFCGLVWSMDRRFS